MLEVPGAALDVMLTDLGLPDGSGLEVIRLARLRHPECEPLVISMFGDEDNVLASIEAGALGYIHKDATPDDIAHTIVEMKLGASPISPMIARGALRIPRFTVESAFGQRGTIGLAIKNKVNVTGITCFPRASRRFWN